MRAASLGNAVARGMRMPSGARSFAHAWLGSLAIGALLAQVFALVRIPLALTPALGETYYDEALTGLMALDVLRGVPQVFYWGEPYGGAIGDAYLAAAGFWLLGPSTLVLRLSALAVIVCWGLAAWRMARRVAGEGFGLWAGLYMALPPVFVSFVQLSAAGEAVSVTCGAVVLAATIRLVDRDLSPRAAAGTWTLLGLAAGAGWWASQMMGMFLVTAVLVLVATQFPASRPVWPCVGLGLFALASLPLWIWNLQHDWATFRHLAGWGGPTPPLPEAVASVTRTLTSTLQDRYWDGNNAVTLPAVGRLLGRILLGAVYVPAVLIALQQLGTWVRRATRGERPWREPLDVVALAFWLTVAAHVSTWFGTSGVVRYSITFYVTLPVLCAAWLDRVARCGRSGWWVAATLAVAVLGYNGLTSLAFVEASKRAPWRPVDAVIARLEQLGVRACYADSRIAQVITFESSERILCADYLGYRNFRQLEAVDAIEDPRRVALVLHRTLQNPPPAIMTATLALMGVAAQHEIVGEYEVFHHFAPFDSHVAPVPTTGWRVRASRDDAAVARTVDRRAWTRWSVPKRPGEWLELDLGQARTITQVSLLPGPWAAEAPAGLRVETSVDGAAWEHVGASPRVHPGVHWWKGHPRVDDSGRVIVRFSPKLARYLRITSLGGVYPGMRWSVAELFVYEPSSGPWAAPAAATEALASAVGSLDHWMDDPTGPHPSRAPVTTEQRRAQVPWGAAFAAINDALAAAPEWEASHHLYGRALARAGWGAGPERALERARRDGAWHEVVRLAELIDADPTLEWRAGRLEAWAQALERLGRSPEAAAIRTRPAPTPARSVLVHFGRELELSGLDGPVEVHPGGTVHVSYHWRRLAAAAHDYWVFLHVDGLRRGNHDQPVGGPGYGLSQWTKGERLRQTVPLAIPADTLPGTYPMRLGVWLPATGRRLRILESDLPQARRAVLIGTLVVTPPTAPGADRSRRSGREDF
jgi:hypothetical protein